MANIEANSSTRNIPTGYSIPTPPTPPESLRNNCTQEQLPQTGKATLKKTDAVVPARLDFVHIFEPWAFRKNDVPKYSVTLIISKNDSATIQKVHEAVKQAYENGKSELQGIELKDIRFPLRDGDAERPDNPAYRNCWFINATNNGKFRVPAVCDIHGKPIADRNQLYSGVWGRVHVSFAAYGKGDNTSLKGIGCYLNAVQKTKDDERIWGVADPFAVFD